MKNDKKLMFKKLLHRVHDSTGHGVHSLITILSLIIFNFFFCSRYHSFCWNSLIVFLIKACRHKFQQARVIP